ncbi:hypothetical protein L226DRAFT_474096 [Lentinus tigrinus ALCF2SS1-7]|uniref:Uncharacterized protein n=1 Tax=Lentinus tigrinus ALCF2SS1-6 TaxID=1328759 RepID=A0A5C2RKS4_9APHY|nr:hypothetical protein L227DRAFT_515193 [Lentinus tigrinus ALCF2SS1-6]RPD67977.1 hypothetical protein L226DRAFT_474096 [Lentinus tigrinus ALCF2SS1-7]
MSVTPLALYQIHLDDRDLQSLNVHAASSSILTNMLQSRFIGRESGLLVLDRGFRDLSDRSFVKQMRLDRVSLERFQSRKNKCDIIIVINTHANPEDGGLMYGPKKTTSVDTIVDHILGTDMMPVTQFRRSMLVVLCCGGFVEHSLEEMRAMSTRFSVVLAFGAPVVDPILVMGQFVTSVVDYYFLGQETLWTAIYRGLKQEIMQHTSIFLGSDGEVHRITDAPWRLKPNGHDVRCCQQVAKYVRTEGSGAIRFRCREPDHQGARTFYVVPLPAVAGVRKFIGKRGGVRYMLSSV